MALMSKFNRVRDQFKVGGREKRTTRNEVLIFQRELNLSFDPFAIKRIVIIVFDCMLSSADLLYTKCGLSPAIASAHSLNITSLVILYSAPTLPTGLHLPCCN